MNKTALKALKGSIKKWEGIVSGTTLDKASLNCPLCKVYYNKTDSDFRYCVGCPVSEKTGQSMCYDTPYKRFTDNSREVWDKKKNIIIGSTWKGAKREKRALLAARQELNFLKSLLPRVKSPNEKT